MCDMFLELRVFSDIVLHVFRYCECVDERIK